MTSHFAGSGMRLAEAAVVMREAMKDKTYQQNRLGEEAARFLAAKRKRLATNSQDAYESTLHRFCTENADLDLKACEKTAGVELIEEWLDRCWGDAKASTYNRHHSALKSFFEFCVDRERMSTNPMRRIERAKERQFERTTFTAEQRTAILASQDSRRDRLALRLLLTYGLRRGSLLAVQFKHFDHTHRRLTIFAKGGKVRQMPIPDEEFWTDLDLLKLELGAQGAWFLMPSARGRRTMHTQPMTGSAAHHWWYRCLERAGLVTEGQRSGEHMHKARHSAAQHMLDVTGNLKAVQVFLGHASIQTTGDIYTDSDLKQQEAILRALQGDDDA